MDSDSDNDENYDYAFKVVVVGDSLTGKSSLLSRYTNNTFYEGYVPTVAVDFESRNVKVNEKAIKANVWDTAGREEYKTISTGYYRGAAGAIIVYDITDRHSFEHVDKWMKKDGKEDLPIVLVGNKSDLEDKRKVTKAEAMTYAEKKQLQYIETSAKDSTNVQEAFQTLLAEILDEIRNREDEGLKPSEIAGVSVPEVPPPDVASDSKDTDESEAEAIDIPVVVVGDSETGKSSLLSRYTKNTFSKEFRPTIGVEFATRNAEVEGRTIKAQVWDTAGQERFMAVTRAYYRRAVGAIIVYDITDRATFEHVDKWTERLKSNGQDGLPIVLVGNKSDIQDKRKVEKTEAMAYAEKKQLRYIETSAKDSTNVQEAFQILLAEILNKCRNRQELGHDPPQTVGLSVSELSPSHVEDVSQDSDERGAETIGVPVLVDEIVAQINGLKEQFDKFSGIEDKVDKLCNKVDQLDTRLSAIESRIINFKTAQATTKM